MTPDQFENLRDEFLIHEARILDWKAGEYTANRDRLLNFKQVAEFLNRRPAEVALAYLLKHIQSIALAVKTRRYTWEWETVSGEGLKQRIADARNYLLLLAACLEEEQLKEPEKWWYTAPGALAREEAIAAFRTRFGRDPDEIGKLGEGSPYSLWCLGPITDQESAVAGSGRRTEGGMTMDWKEAEKHLEAAERAYASIGSAGYFALSFVIRPLRDRFNRGERTEELYDSIMGIEL